MDDNLYEVIIASEACIALFMNTSVFLLMHFKPKKYHNEYATILKWARLPEIFITLMIWPVLNVRFAFPHMAGANRGLCRFGGVMLCNYLTVITLATVHYIICPICVAYSMRFNIFVRKKHKYYRTRYEQVLHFYLWIVLPIAIVPPAYLYLLPEENKNFQGLALEVYNKFSKDGFVLVVYDKKPSGLAFKMIWISIVSEIGNMIFAFFYKYLAMKKALKIAMKQCRFDTAHLIKSNIFKLRIILLLPISLAVIPILIPLIVVTSLPEHLFGDYLIWSGYLCLPMVLIFFMASSINCIYQSYDFTNRNKTTVRNVGMSTAIIQNGSTNPIIR
uniref:G_PROTEIN_RECEP_F1_2 domain-containing protein n=1 Tax=Rhabditophanes sp. KR3021 TaxID=114890 RepID=A0AC35UDD3_9BILA